MRIYWATVALAAGTMATPAFAGLTPTPRPRPESALAQSFCWLGLSRTEAANRSLSHSRPRHARRDSRARALDILAIVRA